MRKIRNINQWYVFWSILLKINLKLNHNSLLGGVRLHCEVAERGLSPMHGPLCIFAMHSSRNPSLHPPKGGNRTGPLFNSLFQQLIQISQACFSSLFKPAFSKHLNGGFIIKHNYLVDL